MLLHCGTPHVPVPLVLTHAHKLTIFLRVTLRQMEMKQPDTEGIDSAKMPEVIYLQIVTENTQADLKTPCLLCITTPMLTE